MKHTNPILTGSVQISGSITADRTLSVTSSVADTAVRVRAGNSGSRPSVSTSIETGSLFYNTDTYALEIYTGVSGSEWQVHATASIKEFSGAASADIEYLVVAGGGGGGSYGGGGAGGYLSSSLSSIESGSSITVTIGGGGAGSGNGYNDPGNIGSDSSIVSAGGTSFTTVTSIGGGLGGDNQGIGSDAGGDGGSGGGGSDGSTGGTNAGGSGTAGQGNDGGDGTYSDPNYMGGGGGGAGTAGADATLSAAGDGGDGLASSITGTSTTRAGGGGGVRYNTTGTWGDGGTGGGGDGGTWGGSSTSISSNTTGTVNTGGGGGAGKAGGKGVVIFAYNSGSVHGAGGLSGAAGNGRRYHQFNESGTFKVGSPDNFNIHTTNLTIHLDAGDYESRGTSTWSDLSGNGWDSTLVSSPTLDQNFYYDFDGSADYGTFTSLGHSALSGQSQGTIECWVNGDSFTSGTGRKTIFGTGHSSQTDRWCVLRIHQTSNIQWSVNADGTSYGCNSDTLPSTSTWYHLCLTFDGTTAKIYQNGVSQTVTVASNGMRWFNAVSSDTLQVGAMDRGSSGNNYDPFDGKIAQLRVYTSALTEAQVLQNYEATKTNFE